MIKEKLKNVWKIVKDTYSAVFLGFITIILGFFFGFVGRKNLRDDRDPEDRIRDDTEKLRRDTDKLRGTTEELHGTTDRLRDNNERLRKLLEDLEEDETEE